MGNGIIACSRTSSYLNSKIWIKRTITPNSMERRVTPQGRTCHFCATIFQEDRVLGLEMSNGQFDLRIFHPMTFSFWGHLQEKAYRYNPQSLLELKEAIDKEIRCIGSEVTRAVFDSMKKKAQDCIQLGGHHLKKLLYLRSDNVKFISLSVIMRPCFFFKSVCKNLS